MRLDRGEREREEESFSQITSQVVKAFSQVVSEEAFSGQALHRVEAFLAVQTLHRMHWMLCHRTDGFHKKARFVCHDSFFFRNLFWQISLACYIVFGITGKHGHCGIPDDCESLPHEAQAFDVSFAGQIALQLPFVSSHFAGFSSHFAGKKHSLAFLYYQLITLSLVV